MGANQGPDPIIAPVAASNRRTKDLAARWAAEYQARTGHALHDVTVGNFTYTYDVQEGRAVCVQGCSMRPQDPRDQSRQAGSPPPREGDDRGHLIAHTMGGGMDINLFSQNRSLNRGHDWREIERYAAANPGTPVAVHLRYADGSDRPTSIEYAYEDAGRGLRVAEFNNDGSRLVNERITPPARVQTEREAQERERR